MTITTCDSCAAGISNADWTHLDACCCNTTANNGHCEDCVAESEYTSISAMLDHYGYLAWVGYADEPGYFECAVCSAICCGGGQLYGDGS